MPPAAARQQDLYGGEIMNRDHCYRNAFSRIARLSAPIGLALMLAVAFTLSLEAQKGQGAANAQITVCASGCNYNTLQAALDNAHENDSIVIGPGTYTEAGKIYITQTLTIEAADAGNRPVIMPAQDTGSGAGSDRAWIIVDPGVTLTLYCS
jgi:pectin methylesterase-like acyl-CoA thioesterase